MPRLPRLSLRAAAVAVALILAGGLLMFPVQAASSGHCGAALPASFRDTTLYAWGTAPVATRTVPDIPCRDAARPRLIIAVMIMAVGAIGAATLKPGRVSTAPGS